MGPAMTRFCWWLVDRLSRLLEPDEQDAVRGDFAESGETGGRALRDLLGLVVRRQLALWKDWRPWVALFGLVGIAAVFLSQIALRLDAALSVELRTYWVYGVHYETGLTVGQEIAQLVCLSLALLLWSWTSGFVLGSLSGRAIWLTRALFYLVLLDASWARFLLSGHIAFHKARLPLIILAAVVPLRISTFVFLLAAIWGVRRGLRLRTLGFRQTLLLAVAIAILTSLLTWTEGWIAAAHQTWSQGVWHDKGVSWQTRLLPLALVSWPVGYMLATASWRRCRGKTT